MESTKIQEHDLEEALKNKLNEMRTDIDNHTHTAAQVGAISTSDKQNNTATSGSIAGSTKVPTMNTLKNALNRTTSVAAADTNYSTVMARGIAAGTGSVPSSLPNGAIFIKYSS